MAKAKHTPGPWQVDRAMGSGSYVRSGTGVLVASCYWMNDQNEVPAPANARLIAAAPDMLDALTVCQSALAMMIAPDAIKNSTVLNAFTQATEAEAKARAALLRDLASHWSNSASPLAA